MCNSYSSSYVDFLVTFFGLLCCMGHTAWAPKGHEGRCRSCKTFQLRRVREYGQQLCIQRSLICLKHLQLQIFTSLTKNFCLSQMTKSHSGGISYAPALKLLPWAAGAGQLTVWHWADGVFNGLFVLYCYFVTLLWPAQSLLQRFEWRNNAMQTRVQDSLDQPHMPDAKSGYG